MGDILQSSSLLWGLKDKDPNCIIHYLAVDTFSGILKNIPFIDKIIEYNVLNILEKVIDNENRNIIYDYFEQEAIIDQLRSEKYDLLLNVTHTDESKALSYVINAKETVGITTDEKGYRIVKHPWANYFYSSNLNRAINRVNLVDIYLKIGNIETTPKKLLFKTTEVAKKNYIELLEKETLLRKYKNSFYCLQLGASVENKQYTPQSYCSVANALFQSDNIIPVFIGTDKEKHILTSIKSDLTTPYVDIMGKTNIDTLGEVLTNANFLLTNDTGTMHIASGVETKIVCIALATAYSHETAAYSENNIIIEADIHCTPCSHQIECLNPICKPLIKPEIVTDIIKKFVLSSQTKIDNNHLSLEQKLQKNLGDIKVYVSLFDNNNLLRLFPLIRKEYTFEDLCNLNYHYLWSLTLGFKDYSFIEYNDYRSILKNIKKELDNWYNYPKNIDSIIKKINTENDSLSEITELTKSGMTIVKELTNYFKNNQIDILQKKSIELIKLDEKITEIGLINSNLRGLTFFFQFGKDNLDSSDLEVLFDKTFELYRQTNFRSVFMLNIYKELTSL